MYSSTKARMEEEVWQAAKCHMYIDDSGILLTESTLRASRAKVLKLWKLERRIILKTSKPLRLSLEPLKTLFCTSLVALILLTLQQRSTSNWIFSFISYIKFALFLASRNSYHSCIANKFYMISYEKIQDDERKMCVSEKSDCR